MTNRIHDAIRAMHAAIVAGWTISPALAASAVTAAASKDSAPFVYCRRCSAVCISPCYLVQDPHGGGLSGLDPENYGHDGLCHRCAGVDSNDASRRNAGFVNDLKKRG